MKPHATHPPSTAILVAIQHQLLKDKPARVSSTIRQEVQLQAAIRGMVFNLHAIPKDATALCQLINYILEEA